MSARSVPKACPWCEGEKVWVWADAVPGRFAVACSNPTCAAVGPFRDSEEQAVRFWNLGPRRPGWEQRVARARTIEAEWHDPAALDRELRGRG